MISCDKCGATMTPQGSNKFTCEYCGNTFLNEMGDRKIENATQQLQTKDGFYYPEVLAAIQRNIEMQKKSNGTRGVYTQVTIQEFSFFANFISSNTLVRDDDGTFVFPTASYPSISVSLHFTNQPTFLQKFKKMDIFSLFTDTSGESEIFYSIDFGNDYVGAAQLFSRIAFELYGATETSHCFCKTWEVELNSGSENNNEGGFSWWWWLIIGPLIGLFIGILQDC